MLHQKAGQTTHIKMGEKTYEKSTNFIWTLKFCLFPLIYFEMTQRERQKKLINFTPKCLQQLELGLGLHPGLTNGKKIHLSQWSFAASSGAWQLDQKMETGLSPGLSYVGSWHIEQVHNCCPNPHFCF